VTGAWRKLRFKELRDLCSSSSIIRMKYEIGRMCSTNEGEEEHL
jgi:hypothetical protein